MFSLSEMSPPIIALPHAAKSVDVAPSSATSYPLPTSCSIPRTDNVGSTKAGIAVPGKVAPLSVMFSCVKCRPETSVGTKRIICPVEDCLVISSSFFDTFSCGMHDSRGLAAHRRNEWVNRMFHVLGNLFDVTRRFPRIDVEFDKFLVAQRGACLCRHLQIAQAELHGGPLNSEVDEELSHYVLQERLQCQLNVRSHEGNRRTARANLHDGIRRELHRQSIEVPAQVIRDVLCSPRNVLLQEPGGALGMLNRHRRHECNFDELEAPGATTPHMPKRFVDGTGQIHEELQRPA